MPGTSAGGRPGRSLGSEQRLAFAAKRPELRLRWDPCRTEVRILVESSSPLGGGATRARTEGKENGGERSGAALSVTGGERSAAARSVRRACENVRMTSTWVHRAGGGLRSLQAPGRRHL